jgi:hypothetical protein
MIFLGAKMSVELFRLPRVASFLEIGKDPCPRLSLFFFIIHTFFSFKEKVRRVSYGGLFAWRPCGGY